MGSIKHKKPKTYKQIQEIIKTEGRTAKLSCGHKYMLPVHAKSTIFCAHTFLGPNNVHNARENAIDNQPLMSHIHTYEMLISHGWGGRPPTVLVQPTTFLCLEVGPVYRKNLHHRQSKPSMAWAAGHALTH